MLLHQFFTPGLAICSYIIADEVTKRAAVIDPMRLIEQYTNYATQEKITITDILETHVHADFVSGAFELKQALGGKPTIHCSAMGGDAWLPDYADHPVRDNDEINLGTVRLQAWHTPGHTPEHLIWLVFDDQRDPQTPALAFTGDLVFVGSIGRPDLLGMAQAGELAKQLYHSLFERLRSLPDHLELFPAHAGGSFCGKDINKRLSSTMGYERHCNPGLAKNEFAKWNAALMENMPAAPPYFARMKQTNVAKKKGMPPPSNAFPVLTSQQAVALLPRCTVLDLRTPEAFAVQHVKGSMNMASSPNVATWAGDVLEGNEQVLLIVSAMSEAPPVIEALKLIGIDSVAGILASSVWEQASEKALWQNLLESTSNITVKELAARQSEMYILDVRTQLEWTAEHIPQAHLIELARLKSSLPLIPKDKPIAVICHSGNRSSLAASILRQAGCQAVYSVQGGMQAWQEAKSEQLKARACHQIAIV